MKIKLSANLSFIAAILSLPGMACNSPILEHANAGQTAPLTDSNKEKTEKCPLSFPKHGYCAELTWDSALNDQDPASFTLRFWKASVGTSAGPYVDPGYLVGAKLWMPSMGHGSSPVTVKTAKDSSGNTIPGIFNGSNVFFIMPGDWDLRIQLKHGSSVHEEATLAVRI